MEINVLRVEYKERTETVKIPFDTVTKRTPDLYVDQTKVSVEGVDGEKIVTYKTNMSTATSTLPRPSMKR